MLFSYSLASLVTHMVKNLPTMLETWVQSLGCEDPLKKGTATPPVFWPGEFHGQRGLAAEVHRVTKSPNPLSNFHFLFFFICRRGKAEDKTFRQHHNSVDMNLSQLWGDSEGQGSLACCSPWCCRVRHDFATDQQHFLFFMIV